MSAGHSPARPAPERGRSSPRSAAPSFWTRSASCRWPAQAKLLRVLEERKVTRLGGNRTVPVEARVVAATNRDLEAEVAAGRFRQDLYFRLSVHVLRVPPLRDRLSDVPELASAFVAAIC